jgi:hypothetical protein
MNIEAWGTRALVCLRSRLRPGKRCLGVPKRLPTPLSARVPVRPPYPRRVQAHAAAAVVNFSEGAEADLMAPHLDTLITKLLTLLQRGKKLVQARRLHPRGFWF